MASPALGSVGILMQRVCYGIILPGLVIGAVLYIHIPAKYGMSALRLFAKHWLIAQSLFERFETPVT